MVSAAFITYKGKVLLFHRDDIPNIKDPDCWDIIGGHIEEEETPEEGLIREVREEIGVDIVKPKPLKQVIDHWGAQTYLYHIELSGDQVSKIKLGNEGKEVKFFNIKDVDNLKLTHNLSIYKQDKDLQPILP